MAQFFSDVIEISTLGLIQDPLGIEAGEKAAEKAAGVQVAGTQAGIAETRRQFDITEARLQEAQEFQRAQQAPFQEAGVGALQQQRILLGLGSGEEERIRSRISVLESQPEPLTGGGLTRGSRQAALDKLRGQLEGLPGAQEAQQQAFAALEQSPGQKFLRDRAQRNLLRNASAIGGLGGGNVRSALVQQGVGFAQQDLQNQFGRLGQLSGRGQTAAGIAGQGALTSAGQIGQFGASAASNIANLGVAGSEARASGILGAASIAPQATGQLLQLGGQFAGAAFGAA